MELIKDELIELQEKLGEDHTPLVLFSIGADVEKQNKLAMFNYNAVVVELDFLRKIIELAIKGIDKNET